MNGILLVDKPRGWTSFDVVAKVRNILIKAQEPGKTLTKMRVGHTGTLDPMATGLLVLVIGSYTKRAGEFSKLDKTYEATLVLGASSTTGDAEGEIHATSTLSRRIGSTLSEAKIKEVLQGFVGQIEQVPPAYSAIKVNGQRAYKLARAGKEVKLEPRKVMIHSIKLTKYSYPFIKFTTRVSSGTYIRSLVEDIGQKLGTGAYMNDLCRTHVGPYHLKDAIQITQKISINAIKLAKNYN